MVYLLILISILIGYGLIYITTKISSENSKATVSGISTLDLNIDWDKVDDEFVIFDLETTGLKSNKIAVDIVEIGAIKVNKYDLKSTNGSISFQALLIPHRGGINADAAKINGITQSMINKDGESAEKVMHEFVAFVGNRKLVGYNVDFDRWFLKRELAHWGIKKSFQYECAYELSRDAFPNLANYKLSNVAKSLGIKNPKEHRALGDCITTLWVYLTAKSKVVNLYSNVISVITDIPETPKYAPNPNGQFFGKSLYLGGAASLRNLDEKLKLIHEFGFKVVQSVGKKTDYAIFVDKDLNINSNNLRKAQQMSSEGHAIQIMIHTEFFNLLKK